MFFYTFFSAVTDSISGIIKDYQIAKKVTIIQLLLALGLVLLILPPIAFLAMIYFKISLDRNVILQLVLLGVFLWGVSWVLGFIFIAVGKMLLLRKKVKLAQNNENNEKNIK